MPRLFWNATYKQMSGKFWKPRARPALAENLYMHMLLTFLPLELEDQLLPSSMFRLGIIIINAPVFIWLLAVNDLNYILGYSDLGIWSYMGWTPFVSSMCLLLLIFDRSLGNFFFLFSHLLYILYYSICSMRQTVAHLGFFMRILASSWIRVVSLSW